MDSLVSFYVGASLAAHARCRASPTRTAAGYAHSAFTFGNEGAVATVPPPRRAFAPGALLDLLQKGLHYKELQAQPAQQPPAAAAGEAASGQSAATAEAAAEYRVYTAQQLLHAQDAAALASSASSGAAAATADAAAAHAGTDDAVVLAGHTADVLVAARCSASGLLATGAADGTARIWNTGSAAHDAQQSMNADHTSAVRRPQATLLHHAPEAEGPLAVHTAVWAPDGRWLATATHDGVARVWSAEGAPPLLCLPHERTKSRAARD